MTVDNWSLPPIMGLIPFIINNEHSHMAMGDLVLFEDELQEVLNILQNTNINIVAIHHHMTHEQPRMLSLHFWGKGPVKDLAKEIQSALEAIGSKFEKNQII